MSMEDLTIREKIRNATRRFSRKGSYECAFNAPSFKVKALCPTGISVTSYERTATNEAVDMALNSIGSLEGKNKPDVQLTISLKDGISVKKNKKIQYSYKIHEVGYCNVDKRFQQIFVFIAGTDEAQLKCHIFLCEDFQKARAICITMAKSFENAFSNWKKAKELSTDFNSNRMVDRRRSADVISAPSKKQLEQRRASDFVTTKSTRLDIRRSSADAVSCDDTTDQSNSSDDESINSEKEQRFEEFLSQSIETGKQTFLRRGSTDWDAIEKDEEIIRKMQGDLILWE